LGNTEGKSTGSNWNCAARNLLIQAKAPQIARLDVASADADLLKVTAEF
jgi:hypothetical protein